MAVAGQTISHLTVQRTAHPVFLSLEYEQVLGYPAFSRQPVSTGSCYHIKENSCRPAEFDHRFKFFYERGARMDQALLPCL
ncbi:hypothetical protein RRG08_013743 [Elysia crispata]|uniref:Uncharacterized protein n=1 Tax=Elysia crispata TaxID=231223 RepID=A0AAE0ZQJ5_9GAST|nr:hypothetical protein RRG08_013743 [Elysia crispata]